MITEKAVVLSYQDGIATVKCQSQSACGACAAKSACGTALLPELTGSSREHIFNIPTISPLKTGQMVEIGLMEKSLLVSAMLLYALPLLVILVSVFLSEQFFAHELTRAIFIFFCTAVSFIALRFFSLKVQRKNAFQPVLLKVLS